MLKSKIKKEIKRKTLIYHFQTRKIDGCFSFNRPSIEIIDEMPKGKQFDYLKSKWNITYTVSRMYDVPEIEINFNG